MSVPDAKFTKGEFEVGTPCSVPGGTAGRGKASLAGRSGGLSELLTLLPSLPHHTSASVFPFHRRANRGTGQVGPGALADDCWG